VHQAQVSRPPCVVPRLTAVPRFSVHGPTWDDAARTGCERVRSAALSPGSRGSWMTIGRDRLRTR
jgi:hypothetical protein